MHDSRPHILIAGAGINGLMAACYTNQAGARVTVCEEGPVPNPDSVSHGAHRLIHPVPPVGRPQDAARSAQALPLWQAILQDIACEGFVKTGVIGAAVRVAIDVVGKSDLVKRHHMPLRTSETVRAMSAATCALDVCQ